jgi:HEAT repeat protein
VDVKCFISHSWRNGEHDFAVKLANALESRGIKKAWVDEREIPGGGYISDQIKEGIQTIDLFLFVMSPTAVASKWCNLELSEALKQRSENGIQIVPLLLKDCAVPEELDGLLYVDFRDAAKFEEALEKLLASVREAYSIRAAVVEVFDSDHEIRFEAAQKLSILKNRFTVPILARRLDPKIEPDPTVRYWLAYALGQIGGEEACAALRIANDRETDLFAREGIAEALQVAGWQNAG